MRLIECYIENFGRLHDFRYTFSEGLNVINEENGYGKTTLSVFIKAMFYGLEDTKRVKLEENDRKHYLPWQGGVCGGWITFTVGTLSYKIERTFAPKAADDTYALYELEGGKASYAYPECAGEKIFGIDADGFERTVFLSERRLSVKNDNQTVSAKLSDLVGYEFDLGELDAALDALDERRKYYYKKGGAGKISEIKARKSDTDAEIGRLKRIADSIPERERELAARAEEIRTLEAQLAEYSLLERNAANEKLYLEKREMRDEAKRRFAEVERFFTYGKPTPAEVREAEARAEERRTLESRLEAMRANDAPAEALRREIGEAEAHIKTLSDVKEKKKSPVPGLIILFGILFAAVGGVLTGVGVTAVGIVLLALAVIGLITGVVLAVRGGAAGDEDITLPVKAFLDRHGRSYAVRDTYLTELVALRASLLAALSRYDGAGTERGELTARLEVCKRELNRFLSSYPTVTDDPFYEIRNMLLNYDHLGERVKEIERELEYLVREYGVNPATLDSEADRRARLLATDPDKLRARLGELRSEQAVREREYSTAREEATAVDEYSERLAELEEELSRAEGRLAVIVAAKEHLSAARDGLTAKYLGKTRAAFAEYISVLAGDDPDLYTMSVDFGVTKSAGSVSRPSEAYSLGTRELYSLAARLALVDSLYEKESPFIVLDDPFVHFDDRRAATATRALKRLAERRQIIYFTCSRSRAV